MSLEQKIEERIQQLLEHEGAIVSASTSARYLLMDAQEEIRALRAEAEKAKLEWFSETEAAKRIGVSKDTLQRLRRARKIPFVQIRPGLYKHTSETIARIAELLEVKPKLALRDRAA